LYESIGKLISIDQAGTDGRTVDLGTLEFVDLVTLEFAPGKTFIYSSNDVSTFDPLLFRTVWNCFENVAESLEGLNTSNNVPDKIRQVMGENYRRTGIFFGSFYFKTKTVEKFGIKPYVGKILLYLLSPCPSFYNNLSNDNQGLIRQICKWPNVCTVAPILNDCNNDLLFGDKCKFCTTDCVDPDKEVGELIIAGDKLQQLTKAETVSIAALGQYITQQLYSDFITDDIKSTKMRNSISTDNLYPFAGRSVKNLTRPAFLEEGGPQTVFIILDIGVNVYYNPQPGTSVKFDDKKNVVSLEYTGASMLNCYVKIVNVTDKTKPEIGGHITVTYPNFFTGERTVSFTYNNNYSNFAKFDGGNNGHPPAVIIIGPPI
jgi:hypothetical protein